MWAIWWLENQPLFCKKNWKWTNSLHYIVIPKLLYRCMSSIKSCVSLPYFRSLRNVYKGTRPISDQRERSSFEFQSSTKLTAGFKLNFSRMLTVYNADDKLAQFFKLIHSSKYQLCLSFLPSMNTVKNKKVLLRKKY